MNETRIRHWTVERLEKFLWQAADNLRGVITASGYHEVIAPLLLLKRVSDQPGLLTVPDRARWSYIVANPRPELGDALNKALSALEQSNKRELDNLFDPIDFNRKPGQAELVKLVNHFGQLDLSDEYLEFGDVLGQAYDSFLGRAMSLTGKRGGEFYTPRAVCRLMAELVEPQAGQNVYDPCLGSGGMLLQAIQYASERDGAGGELALYGQEKNSSAWFMGRMNLLLHGIADASVSGTDSLAEPLHAHDGSLKRFDLVLTSPPFSMNYAKDEVRNPERMRYGWTPEGAKKADLMFVQHVLASLRPDGIGAVVTPHGVLFRGGSEADIRRGFIKDDRLEAVIGIGPNVFSNTNLPACILVVRGTQGPPADRRGRVLFINAEHEVATERAQNRLDPQHVEKIADAFLGWKEIPGFSRIVSLEEIEANDFNINIRRYVDADPPAEPLLDIDAALTGGIPWREIEPEAERFKAFGIDLDELVVPVRPGYRDFYVEGYEATAARIPELTAAREQRLMVSCRLWWQRQNDLFTDLAGTNDLFTSGTRSHLRRTFCEELLPLGILDYHQVTGAFAAWWSDHRDDLRTLSHKGFAGVVDRWDAARPIQPDHPLLDLPPDLGRSRVLDTLGNDLCSRVEQLLVTERQRLIDTYRSWGERYATSMADLGRQYEAAESELRARMAALGYDWPL
ncbi:type I restriction-modification system subunit M [Streptomyces prunicolor]|uniref:type I restriction-modification system subunit M n=1 Tax=Streptomyces prunicolor TaxID=67348 RepID=UPI0033DA8712